MECDLECDLVDNHTRHKHLVYILTISFFFLSGFIVSNFFYDKRSSNALLIEEILLKKDKTPIQSWLHLLGQRKGRAINNVDYIEDQSTEDLANYIDLKMNDLDQQTLQKIQKNIAVADELISRVPNSYTEREINFK